MINILHDLIITSVCSSPYQMVFWYPAAGIFMDHMAELDQNILNNILNNMEKQKNKPNKN